MRSGADRIAFLSDPGDFYSSCAEFHGRKRKKAVMLIKKYKIHDSDHQVCGKSQTALKNEINRIKILQSSYKFFTKQAIWS